MNIIKIECYCESHNIGAVVTMECSDLEPETLFEATLTHVPFIEDGLAEIAFVVNEIVDRGDGLYATMRLMNGSLLITPIRDIGVASMWINHRLIEYVYLYDEHTIFERPIYNGSRAAN